MRKLAQISSALLLAFALIACGTQETQPPDPPKNDLRGERYCEVLLGNLKEGKVEVQVYTSFGLNKCPESDWKALDKEALKAEHEVFVVILNGPRYWMLNAIKGLKAPSGEFKTFGDIRMQLVATLAIDPQDASGKPYSETTVNRSTEFTFRAGQTVFQLISPTQETYTMQTYTTAADATLKMSDLPDLAPRLKLPEGWTFKATKLESDLVLKATEQAKVLQDDLQNTYQKHN